MDIYCWITVLVTSVIVLNHYVSCVQEFHLQPQNKSATQGSTIILKCVIKNKGNGNVQWTRGDFALGIDRSMPEYDRYSMIGTRNNLGGDYIEEFSLKITDLRLEDDDKYRCIVMFTDEHKGILSDYAYVSVLIPPSQPILPGGQTIPVILDKATNISCQALNGKPKAQITWKKDGLRVTEKTFEFGTTQPDGKRVDTTGIVTITASLTDAGKKIECGAWNEALERDDVYWTQATLDVQYAPKIRLTHNNPDRTMREYDDIKFVCTGKANPFESVYKWYRNDELIADENKSIYVIPRIPRDYHGDKIKCEATNSVGTTVTEHSMNILYGPKFKNKEANHISVDRGQRAELRCEADGNPTAGITWRRQGKFPILHSSSTYVIPSVREGMFGVYTCTATVLGFVEISRDVYLTENGPPEIMSDKKQYSDVGETARIQCMTVSSPKPVFIWTRNGEPIDYATSGRFSAPEEGLPYGGKSVLQIMNIQEEDFGQYNCTVYNGKGSDTLVITLQQKEELPTSIIIGGAVGGVAVILIIVIACFAYYRCRHSDNESYAETDSNTEIKKRDKNESPSELTKSTLMDQWRQDYNYRYSADFDEPDVKGNNNGVCASPGEERYGTMPTMQHNNYGGAPTYEPYASDDINVGTGNRYESSYSTGYIPSTFRSPSRTDYNTGRVPANDFTSGRASALDFTNGRTSAVDFPSGRASAVDFNSRIPNSDFTNGRVSAIDFTGRNSTEPNSEPFRLPAADYSTTKLATNV